MIKYMKNVNIIGIAIILQLLGIILIFLLNNIFGVISMGISYILLLFVIFTTIYEDK